MHKFWILLVGMITGLVLAVGFLWLGSALSAQAGQGRLDSNAGKAPWNIQASARLDEVPPDPGSLGIQAPSVLPTPIPGETLVYFLTSDSDATGTALTLLNTDSVAHTVALRGYSYSGVLGYSLNINVPATSLIRLTSDTVAAAPPPSWSTPAPIVTNFTDFTYYASLSLPKGVKVEGYIFYNPGTGTIDPRLDQGAVPLRFSTDPATVFLPAIKSGP